MSTQPTDAQVYDMTDRLPSPVAERPFAPKPDTMRVSERWAVIGFTLVALIAGSVFVRSFVVLELPVWSFQGTAATVGVGFLILACLGAVMLGVNMLRDDYAAYTGRSHIR